MTEKPRPERSPERSLAIALENVTPQAIAGKAADAGSSQGQAGRGAPRVVASGRGAVAEQILQIAFERGVKVRTDSDLAEILRYLYSADARAAAGTDIGTPPRNTGPASGTAEDPGPHAGRTKTRS